MERCYASKKINNTVGYLYESTSHFALAYIALNDLIQNSKRNVSICQNCGRYYLQYSGKELKTAYEIEPPKNEQSEPRKIMVNYYAKNLS